jgi:hypothetical protein
MRIEYRATIDEAIAAHLRLMALSKTARGIKRMGLMFAPLILVLLYLTLPGEASGRLVFSVIAAAVFVPLYFLFCKLFLRRNTRRLLVESLGTDEPVPSEYEFTEDGLTFRQMGTEIGFRWDNIAQINEREEALEFITRNKGLAMIPKRVFRDEDHIREWLDFARERADIAQ